MYYHNNGLSHYYKNRLFISRNNLSKNIPVKKYIDKAIYPIGIIGPLSILPQLFSIWSQRSAVGLSFFTWFTGVVIALFWVTYGVVHKEKPIIISSTLSMFIQLGIVAGISIYK